jgi:iduronate 2-sulfatase
MKNISITAAGLNLALAGFGLMPAMGQDIPRTHEKPNILFIAIDDLKPILGSYGNELIKSPVLDRIASQGTVFTNNHCQQAVCGPSRASLLTGMRPDYTGVWDLRTRMRDVNADILSLPQYLITQGYSTQGIGKIYDQRCVDEFLDKPSWSVPYYQAPDSYYPQELGRPAIGRYQDPGLKHQISTIIEKAMQGGMTRSEANQHAQIALKPSVENIDVPDNAYNDGANALMARDVLIGLKEKNEPFFFAVGFSKPHLPFVAPSKYWDLYNREDMPLATFTEHALNSPEFAYHNSGELLSYTDIPPLASFTDIHGRIGLDIDKQKELIHGYYAAISYIDAQVGLLMHTLDSLDLSRNTIIVIWGDHGWHLGDHDLWCKHSNFEQATRAPLIISAPGQKGNYVSSPTEFIDIFPTLCELAGLPVPSHLDGISLAPVMKNSRKQTKRFAVSQYPRSYRETSTPASNLLGYEAGRLMGYSFRDNRYRYTVWTDNNFRSYEPFEKKRVVAVELYDYVKDPLEKENLAGKRSYRRIEKTLARDIEKFFEEQYKKYSRMMTAN